VEPLDRCDACRSTRPGTAPGIPDAAEDAAVLDLRATVAELSRLAAWIEAEAAEVAVRVLRGARPRDIPFIGAPGRNEEEARTRYGEFVAAAGCVLPGDGAERPDYLEQAERFVPGLHAEPRPRPSRR
jgi:hypothetical protein